MRNPKVFFIIATIVLSLSYIFAVLFIPANDKTYIEFLLQVTMCGWIIFYKTGFYMGLGLFTFKYTDMELHKDYYLSDPDLISGYYHDHKWYMILRNLLFYCGLSWYGVFSFCIDDE